MDTQPEDGQSTRLSRRSRGGPTGSQQEVQQEVQQTSIKEVQGRSNRKSSRRPAGGPAQREQQAYEDELKEEAVVVLPAFRS